MNLQTQNLKHWLKTILGMLGLAILAAALVSSASISKAQAGKMGGGVKAPSPTMAAKTSPGSFNHVANEVRPSKPPSVAKEPCRGRHCPHHWPHTH
jgi:hypothetical protein